MIGNRIRSARLIAGLNQADLAKIVHKGVSTVSEWEVGKRKPDVSLIPDIARALGVSVAYLIGEADTPIPKNELTTTETAIYARALEPKVFRFLLNFALMNESVDDDANIIITGGGVYVLETPEMIHEVMEQTIDFFSFLLYQKSEQGGASRRGL